MQSGISAEFDALMQFVLARLELTTPPSFFIVAIQQPGKAVVGRGVLDV